MTSVVLRTATAKILVVLHDVKVKESVIELDDHVGSQLSFPCTFQVVPDMIVAFEQLTMQNFDAVILPLRSPGTFSTSTLVEIIKSLSGLTPEIIYMVGRGEIFDTYENHHCVRLAPGDNTIPLHELVYVINSAISLVPASETVVTAVVKHVDGPEVARESGHQAGRKRVRDGTDSQLQRNVPAQHQSHDCQGAHGTTQQVADHHARVYYEHWHAVRRYHQLHQQEQQQKQQEQQQQRWFAAQEYEYATSYGTPGSSSVGAGGAEHIRSSTSSSPDITCCCASTVPVSGIFVAGEEFDFDFNLKGLDDRYGFISEDTERADV